MSGQTERIGSLFSIIVWEFDENWQIYNFNLLHPASCGYDSSHKCFCVFCWLHILNVAFEIPSTVNDCFMDFGVYLKFTDKRY